MSGGAEAPLLLRSPAIEVAVEPGRGAQLTVLRRPGGPNVLARHEWEIPPPDADGAAAGLDAARRRWLADYRGGWQELFPNVGAACAYDGVELPPHGEASFEPWRLLERDPGGRSCTLELAAPRGLVLTRTMRVAEDAPVLHMHASVHNRDTRPRRFLWGHHPAFAVSEGTRVDVPATTVVCADDDGPLCDLAPAWRGRWPHAAGRDGAPLDLGVVPPAPRQRMCFLPDVPAAWAALRRPDGVGVGLAWDRGAFPHLWIWQELGSLEFPYFGRARLLAFEPASTWPGDGLAAAAARGHAFELAPGERMDSWIAATLFAADARAVRGIDRAGAVELAAAP